MLRFAANLSMLFAEHPLRERFAAARAAGFAAVEIQFPYELEIAELRQLLADNGLTLVLINAPAGDLLQGGDGLACVPGRQDEFRAGLEQALAYATTLSVPTVNLLAGRRPPGQPEEACEAQLLANLDYAAPRLHAAGVTPVIEAINVFDMPRFLVHSLEDMLRFCKKVRHLKMQFDCYHMQRMGEDVPRVLQEYLPRIGHVQFADSPGRHEPGTGQIDYPTVFRLLRDSGYAGWCGAEYRPSRATLETLAWWQRWRDGGS